MRGAITAPSREMSGTCQYSNAFGAPGTGAHSLRVGWLAAVDLLVTGGAAYLLSRFALGRVDLLTFGLVFILLILVAIPVHEAFCVNTRLNSAIFGRPWPGKVSAARTA